MSLTSKAEEILRQRKIPLTTGYGTGIGGTMLARETRNFIVSLSSETSKPTRQELDLICTFREAIVRNIYRNPKTILDRDYPAARGHNTTILIKGPRWPANGRNGWAYRKMTWTEGPTFSPSSGATNPSPPYTLEQVLERACPGWRNWPTD